MTIYRTAETLEDLDMEEELNSFESVGHAMHVQLNKASVEERFHQYDYYLIMLNAEDVEAIMELLSSIGCSAVLEFEDKCLIIKNSTCVDYSEVIS